MAPQRTGHGRLVAGIDLGGTKVNYTFLTSENEFLLDGLCEHPSRATEGPDICLQQIADGLALAAARARVALDDVVLVGLDTPGPASAEGVLSARGSTNFVHPGWAGFDMPKGLERRLGKPAIYLNDGTAAALWGHFTLFGADSETTSVSAIVGTGLGGGVIIGGRPLKGHHGFGGELGHVLIPYQEIAGLEGAAPACNCGRVGDLESVCSLTAIERTLLPRALEDRPHHPLARVADRREAAKLVRGLAERGDPLARDIFRIQAHALGLFFDEMVNTFDPGALIIGGGVVEADAAFQQWFVRTVRASMPPQREEQAGVPIHIMPNGDTAGARGVAIEALKAARLVEEGRGGDGAVR